MALPVNFQISMDFEHSDCFPKVSIYKNDASSMFFPSLHAAPVQHMTSVLSSLRYMCSK